MAKKTFLVDLDLSKQELQNASIQNLGSDPTGAVDGQIYFNTSTKKLRINNGTEWQDVGKDVDLSQYVQSPNNGATDEIAVYTGANKIIKKGGKKISDLATVSAMGSLSGEVTLNTTHRNSPHSPSDAEKNIQSDWEQSNSTDDGFIKNKPTIPTIPINNVTTSIQSQTNGFLAVWDGTQNSIKQGNKNEANLVEVFELAAYFKKNGSDTLGGNLKMGGHKITEVIDGTTPTDGINKGQLDTAISGVTGGVMYKGGYNASTDTPPLEANPINVKKGDMYAVTTAGTKHGVFLEVGNSLIANKDNPAAATDWTLIQGDLDKATTSKSGIVELATRAETLQGDDESRAITPDSLEYTLKSLKVASTKIVVLSGGATTEIISVAPLQDEIIDIVFRNAENQVVEMQWKNTGAFQYTITANINIPTSIKAYITGTEIKFL